MSINNIDERILWEDIRGEAVNTILGLVECWSLMPYEIEFAKHCFHRCKQRFVQKEEVYNTIANGRIIEFHVKRGSSRVLLRKQRTNRLEDICVVFDIVRGRVITVYINASNDHHDTLREEIYSKELDVHTIIEKCIALDNCNFY